MIQPPLLGVAEGACARFVGEAARTLNADPKITLVLLAAASRSLAEEPASVAFDGLSNLVRSFESSGKTVAFLVDNPAVNEHPELCGPRPLSVTGRRRSHCSVARADFERSIRSYRALIARLQAAGINVLGGVEVYNRIEQ